MSRPLNRAAAGSASHMHWLLNLQLVSMAAPDYSELFRSDELSDLTIVLVEDDTEAVICRPSYTADSAVSSDDSSQGTPRSPWKAETGCEDATASLGARASDCSQFSNWFSSGSSSSSQPKKQVMPGHSLVLYGNSSFGKAKLQNWQGVGSNGKLEICILVPSDRYGVPKVLAAAAAAFAGITAVELQWDTVQALYELPAGCADLDACKGLFAAAAQKLQQELGDLELAWADHQKSQLLLSLPQPVLLQLLQNPATRVASENTVFYTIERWWQSCIESPGIKHIGLQDAKALVELVRVKHYTPLYVTLVMAQSKLAQECFSPEEMAQACTLATAAHSNQSLLVEALVGMSTPISKHPTWMAGQRPPSAMQELEIQWQLPLQELSTAVAQHPMHVATDRPLDAAITRIIRPLPGFHSLHDRRVAGRLYSRKHSWQGRCFMLEMVVVQSGGDPERPDMRLQCCVTSEGRAGAALGVTQKITIVSAEASGPVFQSSRIKSRVNGWRLEDNTAIVFLGEVSSLPAVEAKLRGRGLVHSDGCLHLQGLITNML
ncbi:hypothetical protein COO60DRAFT_1675745 [Scenedesmus sp. NREL 46B-D3]|nr:hypothetical protein COO60DRAFT_1675745 [Scenedesmus sp. NREL 46B-D3]